jgi:hypothetical protein
VLVEAIVMRLIHDEDGGVSPQSGIGAILLVPLIAILALLGMLYLAGHAFSQEGRHGVGHEHWHHQFYQSLKRPDAPGISCCSLQDCSPTTMRVHDGRYQIKVNGEWRDVPMRQVVKVTAPDGGAHVCASAMGITIFCVVLPPET